MFVPVCAVETIVCAESVREIFKKISGTANLTSAGPCTNLQISSMPFERPSFVPVCAAKFIVCAQTVQEIFKVKVQILAGPCTNLHNIFQLCHSKDLRLCRKNHCLSSNRSRDILLILLFCRS
uniref:Uncharacterized protein n=1 Tax=Cacopsylla melanoneura TaxID=428564 RepID=A0A8D8QPZ9_9HEMI